MIWIVISIILGLALGGIAMLYRCGYLLDRKEDEIKKYSSYFELMDRWLSLKESGKDIGKYFEDNNIKTVAIYGIGKIGNHLRNELEKIGVKVVYIIDEGEKAFYHEKNIYSVKDKLPKVDLIVVTPINEYESIKEKIEEVNDISVVSVDSIIFYDYE